MEGYKAVSGRVIHRQQGNMHDDHQDKDPDQQGIHSGTLARLP